MIITLQQLTIILHKNPKTLMWLPIVNSNLPKWNIDTPQRVAAFLSQCAHESLDFTVLKENLNYGADGLVKFFGKYFSATAASYAQRRPEVIANKVYANRMGNGDEASGDGFRFRGRGLIQITGKTNYTAYSKFMYNDDRVVTTSTMLEDPEEALKSAIWYWDSRNLNDLADKEDISGITKAINGGLNGLADRQSRYSEALKALGA